MTGTDDDTRTYCAINDYIPQTFEVPNILKVYNNAKHGNGMPRSIYPRTLPFHLWEQLGLQSPEAS